MASGMNTNQILEGFEDMIGMFMGQSPIQGGSNPSARNRLSTFKNKLDEAMSSQKQLYQEVAYKPVQTMLEIVSIGK